jgi:AraC-like DNA-binding protein
MSGQILTVVAELIVQGLRKTRAAGLLAESDLDWLDPGRDSVPLRPYRALLARVLEGFGAGPILQAGTELREISHPLLFVLLNSDRPDLLIQKEDRLSRYIHSRHGVAVVVSTEDELVLEHRSRTHDPAEPTENLASCGQHIAMLEMIGAQGLTLRFPRSEDPDAASYEGGKVCDPAGRDGFDLWHFRWDRFVPTRRPMEGLDDLLLDQARLRELKERPGVAAAVEQVIRQDLSRSWLIDRVAKELKVSKRTLQRHLSAVGRTFTDLVLDVRTQEARRLLLETDLNVTAIGYVCGFADSSHFNHSFKRRHGCPPGVFREGRGAPGPHGSGNRR